MAPLLKLIEMANEDDLFEDKNSPVNQMKIVSPSKTFWRVEWIFLFFKTIKAVWFEAEANAKSSIAESWNNLIETVCVGN